MYFFDAVQKLQPLIAVVCSAVLRSGWFLLTCACVARLSPCKTARYIGSGEYIQMSGRAGRRGKDDNGTVIVCADETLDLETCKGIVQVSVRGCW